MKIRISLPENRDYSGWLEVVDGSGAVILGPFPAAGRAHDEAAAAHGNARRDPLLPFGDTPLGAYVVSGVIGSGAGTALDDKIYGVNGVVLLEPLSGPAALADAHGRFRLFIQGGDGARLHATAGAVRLLDRDQKRLVALMRHITKRTPCEIITTAKHGAKVELTRSPGDDDPPPLPDRAYVATRPTPVRPASNLGSRTRLSSVRDSAAPLARQLFVVPEHSGSGAESTYYGDNGSGGSDPGASAQDTGASGPNDTSVSPLPPAGTDVAPTPGADLNPPPDQTSTTVDQSGASQLLSTAPPTGLSSPFAQEVGWLASPPQGNPYYPAVTDSADPLSPYIGANIGAFSGTSDAGNANAWLGSQPIYPFMNAPASSSFGNSSSSSSPFGNSPFGSTGRMHDTSNWLASADGGPITPPPPDAPPTPTSNGPPSDQWVNTSTLQGLQALANSSIPGYAQYQTTTINNTAYNVFINDKLYPGQAFLVPADFTVQAGGADDSGDLPLAPAAASGALASRGYVPGFESHGVPTFSRPLGNAIQRNQWQGKIGEAGFEGGSPLGGAFLKDLNTSPYTTASGVPGNPGFFPVEDYQNIFTGNPTSVATSTNTGVNPNTGDPARYQFYNNKYRELVGSLNQGKLNNAAQNLNTTPNDLAARGKLAINADDVEGFRAWLTQQIQNNPGDYPPGLNPTQAAEQIISHGLTMGELTQLIAARGALPPNLSPGDVQRLMTPENLMVARTGSLGGALGESSLRGGLLGAGLSTGMQLGQMYFSNQQYSGSQYFGAAAQTAIAGGLSGAAGASIETAFGAGFSQATLQSASNSALTPLLGNLARGGLGGGPAAAIFQVTQMALSDQSYSAEDYEAKATRAGVEGALSGALSAGLVGAIWGTEVPLLGNAVGFVVGFAAYFLIDYDFGDDIESGVRSLDGPSEYSTDDPEDLVGYQ